MVVIKDFIKELETEEIPTSTMKIMYLFRKGELNPSQRTELYNYIDSTDKGKRIQKYYQLNTKLISDWVDKKIHEDELIERRKSYIPLPTDKYVFCVSDKQYKGLDVYPIYITLINDWNNKHTLTIEYSDQEKKELLQTVEELGLLEVDNSVFITGLKLDGNKMREELLKRGFKQIDSFDNFIKNSEVQF